MSRLDEVLLTEELSRTEFLPMTDSVYIHGLSPERRSQLDEQWLTRAKGNRVMFAEVIELSDDEVIVDCPARGIEGNVVNLRDVAALDEVVRHLGQRSYLDITGLTYQAWAPLLRSLLTVCPAVWAVYVEPASYARSVTPTQGMIFDLSERIKGIAPLPGFASLRWRTSSDSCFVPILGFEGARLGYVIEHVQPAPDTTVPIVGVPGFKPEYPFHAYTGNRTSIEREYLASSVRYTKANCPFDLFLTLYRVSTDFPEQLLRVAPIGTKPHGLGAVLFALSRPAQVELIYDHPVRKEARTAGEARVCVYDVGAFSQSSIYRSVDEFAV